MFGAEAMKNSLTFFPAYIK